MKEMLKRVSLIKLLFKKFSIPKSLRFDIYNKRFNIRSVEISKRLKIETRFVLYNNIISKELNIVYTGNSAFTR